MAAIVRYTHQKSVPEVPHHSVQHISWSYGDSFSSRLLKLFQSLRPMFVDFTFEVAPQKEIAGAQIRGARWTLIFAPQRNQVSRKHSLQNGTGATSSVRRRSILLKPEVLRVLFFKLCQLGPEKFSKCHNSNRTSQLWSRHPL